MRPTPTQEENDLARLGIAIEFAPDGSPPDPHAEANAKALASLAVRRFSDEEKARLQKRR